MSDYSVPSAMMFQAAAAAATTLADSRRQYKWQKETEARQEQYNIRAEQRAQGYNQDNMALSYQYGEQAADAADARTRALYEDLYGIGAQMRQLKENGLSPGLMYGKGGIGGSSTPSGAQGTGAHSGNVPAYPAQAANPLAGVQLSLGWSQVAKNLAEARAINKEQKREDTKLPSVLETMQTNVDEVKANIDLLKQEVKNKKAQEKLTNLQSDYQDTANFINDATTTEQLFEAKYNIWRLGQDIQYWANNLDIQDATKETSINTIKQNYNNMVAEYNLKLVEADLKKSQIEMTEEQKRMIEPQIQQIQQDIEESKTRGELNEEKTRDIARRYKLDVIFGGIEAGTKVINSLANVANVGANYINASANAVRAVNPLKLK